MWFLDENLRTDWPSGHSYSRQRRCICRCELFALVCQVKRAELPAVVRVSNFRWSRRNSKLFALCTCEILLKFTDFSLMFFFWAFITILKINTEKASIPNVLWGTWQRDVFLSCTSAPVLLAWLESKEREIWRPCFSPPGLYYRLEWHSRTCTKATTQEVGTLSQGATGNQEKLGTYSHTSLSRVKDSGHCVLQLSLLSP